MEGSSSESMDLDQMSLKDLTIGHYESDHTLNNSTHMTSSMLSRTSSSSSSVIGDYIGTESCFDVLSDDNDAVFPEPDRIFVRACRRREAKAAAREFPPPIPRLARTENLPSHMPWVLKREYTSDGRLILREEKVRHHEYFRAHRSNGRLTLHLVPLDDDNDDVLDLPLDDVASDDDEEDVVLDNDEGGVSHDQEDDYKVDTIVHDDAHHDDDHDDDGDDDDDVHHDEHDGNGDGDGDGDGGGQNIDVENVGGSGDDDHRVTMLSSVADQTVVESGVITGGGGGGGSPRGKCLKSCFLGMQVPEIRPVLS